MAFWKNKIQLHSAFLPKMPNLDMPEYHTRKCCHWYGTIATIWWNIMKLDHSTVKNIKHCSLTLPKVHICLLYITIMSSYSMLLKVFTHLNQKRIDGTCPRCNTHITLHANLVTTIIVTNCICQLAPFKQIAKIVFYRVIIKWCIPRWNTIFAYAWFFMQYLCE